MSYPFRPGPRPIAAPGFGTLMQLPATGTLAQRIAQTATAACDTPEAAALRDRMRSTVYVEQIVRDGGGDGHALLHTEAVQLAHQVTARLALMASNMAGVAVVFWFVEVGRAPGFFLARRSEVDRLLELLRAAANGG